MPDIESYGDAFYSHPLAAVKIERTVLLQVCKSAVNALVNYKCAIVLSIFKGEHKCKSPVSV